VVNDLGGARDGSGQGSSTAADQVVQEIRNLGGQAVANYDSVATAEGGENIVKAAIEAFGRLDILINNAGILRDKSFGNMTPEHWKAVLDVHLSGAYHVTRPAFQLMKQSGFGRIILTTSAAGLYGNFGQTNYSAAKMALVGLMNVLKLEGRKYDIKVNTVAPIAASRLTADVMPPELLEKAKPEHVVPLVTYLCSDRCTSSGMIFNAGLGYFNRAAVVTGPAVQLAGEKPVPTPEEIEENFDRIDGLEGGEEFSDLNAALADLLSSGQKPAPGPTPTTEAQGGAIQDIFERMAASFNAKAAEGLDVVFQFVISGPGGGEWQCIIRDQACRIDAGSREKPACTLRMAADDFAAMMSGALAPMQAFTASKLTIQGDVMKSQLLQKLFNL
jgi:NAD(P)-dependent dehydrogenase (short-subunit alcohol dehydrogenase family)/putative sterol carrier protein